VYDIEILDDDVSVSSTADRSKFAPAGIAGGKDALGMETKIIKDQEEYAPPLNPKFQITLSHGDRVIRNSPGGGGHGPPSKREKDRILADLNKGYITPEHARKYYDVDVSQTENGFKID
jgi:N-methylhydantoinase B